MADGNDSSRDFDVVVVGTGLTESIVAAAAARAGKKVLHVDDSDCYGGAWASLPLSDFAERLVQAGADPVLPGRKGDHDRGGRGSVDAEQQQQQPSPSQQLSASPQFLFPHMDVRLPVQGTPPRCYVPKPVKRGHPATCYSPSCRAYALKDSWQKLTAASRRFNLDVSPKLCHARGDMVGLLVAANIGRYLEFQPVASASVLLDSEICQVPCNKQTLFSNKKISASDKRQLLNFLQWCVEGSHPFSMSATGEQQQQQQQQQSGSAGAAASEEGAAAAPLENVSFQDIMQQQRLSASIRPYVQFAIADVSNDASAEEGIRAVQRYIRSLKVYGATPFIYPQYGFGEVSQAFCRLCAVYGGVYMLRTSLCGLNPLNEGSTSSDDSGSGRHHVASVRLSDGQEYRCKSLVAPYHLLAQLNQEPKEPKNKDANSPSMEHAPLYDIHHMLVIASTPAAEPSSAASDTAGEGNSTAARVVTIPPTNSIGNTHTITAFAFGPATQTVCEGRTHWHLFTRMARDGDWGTAAATATTTTATTTTTTTTTQPAPPSIPASVAAGRTILQRAFDAVRGGATLQVAFHYVLAGPCPRPAVGSAPLGGWGNVYGVNASPDSSLGADAAVLEARRIFRLLAPEEKDFLPAAPNPEDVVWDHADDEGEDDKQQQQQHHQQQQQEQQPSSSSTAAEAPASESSAVASPPSLTLGGPQQQQQQQPKDEAPVEIEV